MIAKGDISAKDWDTVLSARDDLDFTAAVGREVNCVHSSEEIGNRLEIEAEMAEEELEN